MLRVQEKTIYSENATTSFTVCLISDLHLTNDTIIASKVITALKQKQPDFICIAGDLEDHVDPNYKRAISFLNRCAALCPVICINGNSDMCEKSRQCLYCFVTYNSLAYESALSSQIYFLRNEKKSFSSKNVVFYGFDEATRKGTIQNDLDSLTPNAFSVLLVHNTTFIATQTLSRYNLVFAGHTHGGQIGFLKPFLALYDKSIDIRYIKNSLPNHVITSTGVGTSFLPFRFLVPPTIYSISVLPSLGRQAL